VKRVIVTADDFGAALEVNEAVEHAHRAGILRAASLMVAGPAAADAVNRARRMPGLRVGLHLVLVEGRPLLAPESLGRLVDRAGSFRTDMAAMGVLLAVSPAARRQLAAEISAQFEAFRATGLELDHCNAHKHFQLHPVIGELIVRIGARFGLKAARVPHEPVEVLRRIERDTPRARGTVPWAALLRRRLQRAGIASPARVFGLAWSGQMTRARLHALLSNLPQGVSEIYLHPATGAYAGSAPGYRYAEELEALTAPENIAACRPLELGGFVDFLGDGTRAVA
jgi:chitin disaccharide deacetylase